MATFAPPTFDATLPEDVETLAFEAQKAGLARCLRGAPLNLNKLNRQLQYRRNLHLCKANSYSMCR